MLQVCSLRRLQEPYRFYLQLQEALVGLVQQGTLPDTLLVVEHAPVYTIGKRGTDSHLLTPREALQALGAEVVPIPRGGEVTWHGPGQLVAYPLLALRRRRLGVRAYVEALEDGLVAAAGAWGVAACGRVPGKTGVWVGERKLGAIGVRVTGGVTSHGAAFNVAPDLTWYDHIIPCGTPDKEVTSLAAELGRTGSTAAVGGASMLGAGSSTADMGGAGGRETLHDSTTAAYLDRGRMPLGLDMNTAEDVLVETLARHLGHPSWCWVTPQLLLDAVGQGKAGEQQVQTSTST